VEQSGSGSMPMLSDSEVLEVQDWETTGEQDIESLSPSNDPDSDLPLPAIDLASARVSGPTGKQPLKLIPATPPPTPGPAPELPPPLPGSPLIPQSKQERLLEDLFGDAPSIETGSPSESFGQLPVSGAISDSELIDLGGPRRANVHFVDGGSSRGILREMDPTAPFVRFETGSGDSTRLEELPSLSLKAVFILLPKGASYPPKKGRKISVTMIDGRHLTGFSPDYNPNSKAFILYPEIDRGNVEQVIIYQNGVETVQPL
jgi:hypothetical protein